MTFISLILLTISLLLPSGTPTPSKIDASLAAKIASNSSLQTSILISFNPKTSTILQGFSNSSNSLPRSSHRGTEIARRLKAHSTKSQGKVISFLKRSKVAHTILWITNQILIRNANSQLIKKLGSSNFPTLTHIREEKRLKRTPTFQKSTTKFKQQSALNSWGLRVISAPEAWALPGGNSGEGVTVGVISSGAHASHIDLAPGYVGTDNYGWMDATRDPPSPEPNDNDGDGTAALGIIVGKGGLGVAPDAGWMACQAWDGLDTVTVGSLLFCGQWMFCPTLFDGSEPDCTKAPGVALLAGIMGPRGDAFFDDVLLAWHAAGVIPVFGIGDSGPGCLTTRSPGDSVTGVIAVGATTIGDGVLVQSSRGPAMNDEIKPDLSAPGQNIVSSVPSPDDDDYNWVTGSSMAAGYVAGVVALLKSHNPDLTFDEVKNLLTSRANTVRPDPTGEICGSVEDNVWPNNGFGWGIVNARNALQELIDQGPTEAPSTSQSTEQSSTVSPSTVSQSTEQSSTVSPSTVSQSTEQSSTVSPSTVSQSTEQSSTVSPSTVSPTPIPLKPYPCVREGYFAITTTLDKAQYCPSTNRRCDIVLCSWYDNYGAWIRVFYNCIQNIGNQNNHYYFDEGRQTCVRVNNIRDKV